MKSKDITFLGLTESEARVYLAALELGETTIARIARKAGQKRTTTTGIVDSLKGKGLMSSSKNRKRNVYSAVSPNKFREDLALTQKTLEGLMPELLSLANVTDSKPAVRFYEGFEGIKEAYQHTLEFKDYDMYFWVSDITMTGESADYWYEVYQPKRIGNRIRMRAIAPDTPNVSRFKEEDAVTLRETRLDSKNHFKIRADIMLYARRFIIITSFNEMFSLVIESPLIFEALRAIFESHWQSLENRG